MKARWWLAVLAGTLSFVQETVPRVATPSPLAHVAVIGASLSSGLGNGGVRGDSISLADIMQVSIREKHDAPRDLAKGTVFVDWKSYAVGIDEALMDNPPSALIAVDYLFWSVHGLKGDAERKKLLELALAGLEKFSCPILLGDLPDVSDATKGNSPALHPAMVPSAALRELANSRIREWATHHANVTVVPLADLVSKVYQEKEIQIHGSVWRAGEVARLLQGDHLHPTAEGLVVIWIAVADAWMRADKKLSEESFELKAGPLLTAALKRLEKPPK